MNKIHGFCRQTQEWGRLTPYCRKSRGAISQLLFFSLLLLLNLEAGFGALNRLVRKLDCCFSLPTQASRLTPLTKICKSTCSWTPDFHFRRLRTLRSADFSAEIRNPLRNENIKSFEQIVKSDTDVIQDWLENLYESVDYEAALTRAGIFDDVNEDEGIEDDEISTSVVEDGMEDTAYAEDETEEGAELCEGKEGELTYGEMDLQYFIALLHRLNPPSSAHFVDLGSGRGQLVLAASRLRRWRLCTGIEIMPEVLEIGRGALQIAQSTIGDQMSPTQFFLADIYKFTEPLEDADFVFVYATCFATTDGITLSKLSSVLHDSLKLGCTVITINKRLDVNLGFDLVETLKGPNPDSITSAAVAYVWRFRGRGSVGFQADAGLTGN